MKWWRAAVCWLACSLAACVFHLEKPDAAGQPGPSSTSADAAGPAEMGTRPNLPFPTMGGKQLWADRHWYAGWRVQQHVWTGHARLLDRSNVRRAWGSLEACEAALQEARDAGELQLQSQRIAVLVHGLGRSRSSMSKMRKALSEQGWEVLDMGYPSTRRSLEEHAEQLGGLLDRLAEDGIERVDFVTHSLGGIVVRAALARDDAWQQQLEVGRLVMLAPPSQGSALAQALKDFLPFRFVLGEVGPQLSLDEADKVPAPSCRFAVVAAQRGDGGGWNPLLKGKDDGVVRVEETKLAGMEDFLLVRGLHTFVMDKAEVVEAVIRYLESGDFGVDGEEI